MYYPKADLDSFLPALYIFEQLSLFLTIQGSGFIRFTRHRNDKNYIDVPASEGMSYCMTEESRYNWAHQPYGEDRISITIRAVPCKSPKIKELGFNE